MDDLDDLNFLFKCAAQIGDLKSICAHFDDMQTAGKQFTHLTIQDAFIGAVDNGHIEIVKFLRNYCGKYIQKIDINGLQQMAVDNNNPEMIRLLVDIGVEYIIPLPTVLEEEDVEDVISKQIIIPQTMASQGKHNSSLEQRIQKLENTVESTEEKLEQKHKYEILLLQYKQLERENHKLKRDIQQITLNRAYYLR